MKPQLVFLHGLESGPHGSKYQALRKLDPNILTPDCTGILGIDKRLEVIEESLAEVEWMVIVGSSFGGLAALLFAQKNRDRVAGCLLCAPALPKITPNIIVWHPDKTIILHGTRDEIVPFQSSLEFSKRHGARLIEVDDDHRLSLSSALMVEAAAELIIQ